MHIISALHEHRLSDFMQQTFRKATWQHSVLGTGLKVEATQQEKGNCS
jgi:hypothetical protein